MNLKQLEAFVCIAETRNFSAAARKLYLTQPTVSAHIQALEKELGVRLFIRTTKDVELSGDGERLYENARKMLQLEKNILRDFTRQDMPDTPNISVGASTVPGQYILPQILALFSRTYPGNQLKLTESDSTEVVRMIQNGSVEVGFTGTMLEDPECVFEPFYDDRLAVITPNSEVYRQYAGSTFPVERLMTDRFIIREDGSGTRKETERYLRSQGVDSARMNVVATISNQETIKKSVSSGMGIAILSSVAVEEDARQGNLLCFPLEGADQSRKLYMVWSRNHKPGQAARLFIQFVRELYAY